MRKREGFTGRGTRDAESPAIGNRQSANRQIGKSAVGPDSNPELPNSRPHELPNNPKPEPHKSLAAKIEAMAASLQNLKIAFDPETGGWQQVEPRKYKYQEAEQRGMGWRGITRYTFGRPPALPAQFELRYFEVEPGGYSSLEKHEYVHLIVVIKGQGRALVGERVFDLKPFDVLYVPPHTPHRWLNESNEPFGFLCPADADRDRPQPLTDEEWEALTQNPETAPYVF